MWKNIIKVFCCCFEWPYPVEFLHNFKTKKKKCLAIATKKQIALCLTLSIYFSLAFARLADSRIVAKINKQSENRTCAIWEKPRAFFASRFTARMHVTIFEPG